MCKYPTYSPTKMPLLKMNDLCNKYQRKLTHPITQIVCCAIFVILTVVLLPSCTHMKNPQWTEIDDLLWNSPDSCLHCLEQMDYSTWNRHQQQIWVLKHEHARMKLNHGIEDDSVVIRLKEYFEGKKDYQHAGEACYLLGRNIAVENAPLATYYLKRAEAAFDQCENGYPIMIGMTYYSLGMCEEDNRLFEVARNYYCKALPYMQSNPYYAACAYRNIFRCSDETDSQVNSFIDSALLYARLTPYEDIIREIEIIKYDNLLQFDTSLIFENEKYLCDSLGYYVYANKLAEHYLNNNLLDSAQYYIDLLALDTANSVWSKEHYYYLQAQHLSAIGKKDSAIIVLQDLHNRQTAEIENSAYTRMYMVEQHYDAERERAGKEKAQLQRRIAYLVVVILMVLMVLGAGVLIYRWQRERAQALLLAEQNKHLQDIILQKRKALHKQLLVRIEISKNFRKQMMAGNHLTAEQLEKVIQDTLYFDQEHWQAFAREFDDAYDNLLVRIAQTYQSVSVQDLQYIALVVTGCDTESISLILNLSNRTIWNRKHRIRQHLNLPQDTDLDEWLRNRITPTFD